MAKRGARYLDLGPGNRGGVAMAASRRAAKRGDLLWRVTGALAVLCGVVIVVACVGTWLWPLGWVATLWGSAGVAEGGR